MRLSATARFTPRGDLGRFVEAHITPAVRVSVEAGCNLIKSSAQGYCPVRTGALRDSISVEIDETPFYIAGKVGPHTDYAAFVEYGTGRRGASSLGAGRGPYGDRPGQVAQPYMRPALDESRAPIKELFRGNLSLALRG